MKMKWKRWIGVLVLLALVATTIFTSDKIQVLASEIDTDALEEQKQDTLDKIKDIKSDLSEVKSKIKELEATKTSLKNYIAKLDQEANTLQAQIAQLNTDIEAKQAEIAQKQTELEEAQAVADKQ